MKIEIYKTLIALHHGEISTETALISILNAKAIIRIDDNFKIVKLRCNELSCRFNDNYECQHSEPEIEIKNNRFACSNYNLMFFTY